MPRGPSRAACRGHPGEMSPVSGGISTVVGNSYLATWGVGAEVSGAGEVLREQPLPVRARVAFGDFSFVGARGFSGSHTSHGCVC